MSFSVHTYVQFQEKDIWCTHSVLMIHFLSLYMSEYQVATILWNTVKSMELTSLMTLDHLPSQETR
jgi:hypothetical protein